MTIICQPAAAAVDVNNFQIQDFQIDYYLSRDSGRHAVLKTVESIAADFPTTDQNHGLERAIPTDYDGHTTDLAVVSVTDAAGSFEHYTIRRSNGSTILRIGKADSYVHGMQTYKITYTQREVTKYFKDTNDDEFYWDTDGTQWAVPIDSLTARLHLASGLPTTLGQPKCYFGSAGSTDTCPVSAISDGYAITTSNLQPYQNVSLATGFQAHSFAVHKASHTELLLGLWMLGLVLTGPLALGLIIWFSLRISRKSSRRAEIGTIIPEYVPPANTSVSAAGNILGSTAKIFSAQLIDLAVRQYLKLYQTQEKSWLHSANYELEIIKDISDLTAEEQELLTDIFDNTAVGSRLDMSSLKRNRSVSINLSDNKQKLDASISGTYALRAKDAKQSAWFRRAGIITLVLAIVTLSIWLLLAAIIALVASFRLKPLSDKGLELVRYLKGLEMYIKTAEVDRLRMLQSPEGAQKLPTPIDINDKRQLVKLYERVLPYAILFGQEKDWNKQLGQYYESLNESPAWFSGNGMAFNALAFSSAMTSFDSVATYSSPSSSSTGGSGGGGFSGGGGGGGGGGGW